MSSTPGPPVGPPVGPPAGPPPYGGPPPPPPYGGPPPPPPPYGWPPGPPFPPPPRKGGGATALVVVLAVLALVAVVGGGGFVAYRVLRGSSDGGPSASPSSEASCPSDTFGDASDLTAQMTSAIQRHRKKDWLALAANDQAKAALQRWWANVRAIGFTTGGVATSTSSGGSDTSLKVSIGVHNRLDGTLDGKPAVPASTYRLGLTRVPDAEQSGSSPTCHYLVTSFSSLEHTPWDDGTLHVARGRSAEVVAPTARAVEADKLLPLVEQAVDWTRAFYRAAGRSSDLTQRGLLVFLPGTSKQERSWFRTEPGPASFPGTSFLLGGLNLGGGSSGTGLDGRPLPPAKPIADAVGGTRALLTSSGQALSPRDLTSLEVGQYVYALYSTRDVGAIAGGPTVPRAVSTGAQRLVQAYFAVQPADGRLAARTGTPSVVAQLLAQIRPRAGSFDGRWPTDGQLAGGPAYDYYTALAASTFAFQADTTNLNFALQCVADAYTQGGGPFGGVVTDVRGSRITFGAPAEQQRRWADWLRARV